MRSEPATDYSGLGRNAGTAKHGMAREAEGGSEGERESRERREGERVTQQARAARALAGHLHNSVATLLNMVRFRSLDDPSIDPQNREIELAPPRRWGGR